MKGLRKMMYQKIEKELDSQNTYNIEQEEAGMFTIDEKVSDKVSIIINFYINSRFVKMDINQKKARVLIGET